MPPRKRRYSLRWTFERTLRPEGIAVIAGVDEVGRGCWAGPVYAAAAILPDGLKHRHLNDSKMLIAEARAELSQFLCEHPGGALGHRRGDDGGDRIAQYSRREPCSPCAARWRASKCSRTFASSTATRKRARPYREITVIDGDARCPSIAAASVIAKVARDLAMEELAALYPAYGLENHKGYGTPEHQRALTLHGPCPIHRRGFKPIRDRTYASGG